MNHITQDERVMIGLNGNLYFSNLLRSDSRNDYMCNAQYFAARTLLQETIVTLNVLPSESKRLRTHTHTHTLCHPPATVSLLLSR